MLATRLHKQVASCSQAEMVPMSSDSLLPSPPRRQSTRRAHGAQQRTATLNAQDLEDLHILLSSIIIQSKFFGSHFSQKQTITTLYCDASAIARERPRAISLPKGSPGSLPLYQQGSTTAATVQKGQPCCSVHVSPRPRQAAQSDRSRHFHVAQPVAAGAGRICSRL